MSQFSPVSGLPWAPLCVSLCVMVFPRSLLRITAVGYRIRSLLCGMQDQEPAGEHGCGVQAQESTAVHGCGDAASASSASQLSFLELLSEPRGTKQRNSSASPLGPAIPLRSQKIGQARMANKLHQSGGARLSPPRVLGDPLDGSRASPIRKH